MSTDTKKCEHLEVGNCDGGNDLCPGYLEEYCIHMQGEFEDDYPEMVKLLPKRENDGLYNQVDLFPKEKDNEKNNSEKEKQTKNNDVPHPYENKL